MRLARLELKDVGPFEDAVFEVPEPKGPGELVLFEGPNGSGKTTIMQAIACALGGRPRTWGEESGLGSPRDEITRRCRPANPAWFVPVETTANDREDLTIRSPASPPPLPDWSEAPAARIRSYEALSRASGPITLDWAAFAFQGHQPTPVVATRGPNDITVPPLRGALSFGASEPASAYFGQFLTNVEFDRIKAALYAQESPPSEERDKMARIAEARRDSLRRFETVFSRTIERTLRIDFPFGQHSPGITIDGERIPIDLLGEGLRSTIAWLADLMVRLERITWADTSRSPLEQDFWLILDEIDESLHPTMQARILPAIRELFPNARVYATTHSPFVVASVGEGTIFAIRPDKDHKVRGVVEPRALEHGQSLEFVTSAIFQAPHGFVDEPTREALEAHDRDVQSIARKAPIDWPAFLARRRWLMSLNEEVSTVVALQEVRVRAEIQQHIRAQAEAAGGEAGA
jgi:energy-coupling factor transporter ATP-binding protein EcfA2